MKILKAYKTQLNPNNKQRTLFVQYCGAARYIFNWGLNDRIEKYKNGEKTTCFTQSKEFNAIKDELCPWIREYAYALQKFSFQNLDFAYKNFFRRVKSGGKPGFPKFKSKKNGLGNFTLDGTIKVEYNRIKLPVIGWVRLKETDYMPTQTKVKNATISERANNWYVSILVEEEYDPTPLNENIIGIDFGIKSLVVLSNGKVFENQKTLDKNSAKLKRLQRELSRRKIGGTNREKTKKKIAKQFAKVSDIRRNITNEISSYVVYKVKPKKIVLEDLNVKQMYQDKRISPKMADASFGELRRQFEYKSKWTGTEVIVADRYFPSSKTCSNCGNVKEYLNLNERTYKCESCGIEIDRDLNAALNLKNYN